ncbi:class F sortase [Candidatus Parcubacteria bacterium]|nr:class F sortase [Candidatus Parcubacteria bacterium]
MKGRYIPIIATVGTLLSLTIFVTLFARVFFYAPAGAVALPPKTYFDGKAPPEGYPGRLVIPALGIDAPVEPVGKNGRGEMSAPSTFSSVSWYKEGTVPGEKGSAVMAGHVDNGLALAGVFKKLSDLKEGDDILVVTKGGAEMRFAVRRVESFPYKEVPLDELFSRDDKTRLNLVTCDGAWVRGERTYDHRLVVFAELL